MRTMDGSRGAMCELSDKPTERGEAEARRKLKRLADWADYFYLTNLTHELIERLDSPERIIKIEL